MRVLVTLAEGLYVAPDERVRDPMALRDRVTVGVELTAGVRDFVTLTVAEAPLDFDRVTLALALAILDLVGERDGVMVRVLLAVGVLVTLAVRDLDAVAVRVLLQLTLVAMTLLPEPTIGS